MLRVKGGMDSRSWTGLQWWTVFCKMLALGLTLAQA